MTVQAKNSVKIVLESGIFDLPYYADQAKQNFSSIEAAISHYLEQGHLKKLNPHPLFDTTYYLKKNQDVAAAAVNPLLHYVLQGGFENRNPSEDFDGYFYLSENPDVKEFKANPLSHFILIGADQGRKPSAVFDTIFYVTTYPEVKESRLNALAHYVIRGKSEGKKPNSRPLYPRDLYLKMRQLEPLLPPFKALKLLRESKESFVSNQGVVYDQVKQKIAEVFSHLFVTSNQIASLQTALQLADESAPQGKPLIIVCGRRFENTDTLIDKLSSSHQTIELQNFGKKLESEEELQIICRLAIQAEPRVIHGINSKICFDLFKRLHKPLSLKSKLFASVDSFTADDEGIPGGPNVYLSACADALSAIYVKNDAARNQLIDQIGFEKEVAKNIIVRTQDHQ